MELRGNSLTARAAPVAAGRRRLNIVVVVVIVVAALLCAAVLHAAQQSTGTSSPWSTQSGVDTKTGFLDGCRRSAGTTVDCDCAFARITGQAAYDTPAGFDTLGPAIASFQRTKDPSTLPRGYVSALLSCRRSA